MKAIVVIEIVLNKELDKEVVDEFDISSLYFSKAKNFNSLFQYRRKLSIRCAEGRMDISICSPNYLSPFLADRSQRIPAVS